MVAYIMKKITIASAQGFFGDYEDAAKNQLLYADPDYLVFDYLAELTMSILSKQKSKDPSFGYAKIFPKLIADIAPLLIKKKCKVLANAGGVNPKSCAKKIKELLSERNIDPNQFKIAIVTGDEIINIINQELSKGEDFYNLDNDGKLSKLKKEIVSANAYLGREKIVDALKDGADIIITGRVIDAALTLAPLEFEFNYNKNDYNSLARGILAGHLLECGAQASGGNCSYNWQSIPNLEKIGFPLLEAYEDGKMFITKAKKLGGRVNIQCVKEQLVYEIGNPKEYYTPDVIADFTSVNFNEVEKNVVEISEVKGEKPTNQYKVSLCYENGFKATGTLIYTWPDVYEKILEAQRIIKARLVESGFSYAEVSFEHIGLNACHKDVHQVIPQSLREIMLRASVRSYDKEAVEYFTRQLAPLVLGGPPGASGYTDGRPKVISVYSYFPTLIDKSLIKAKMEIV